MAAGTEVASELPPTWLAEVKSRNLPISHLSTPTIPNTNRGVLYSKPCVYQEKVIKSIIIIHWDLQCVPSVDI